MKMILSAFDYHHVLYLYHNMGWLAGFNLASRMPLQLLGCPCCC